MKTLVLISLLLLGTVAASMACTPATEETVVSKGVGMVQVSEDAGKAGSTSDRPRPTPFNTLAPEEIPEGVSPALAMDAQYYAKDYGVELSEAIRRLTLQEPIGKLGATLESNEAGTLGGFWIQHEPEYRVVAAFTKDGEKTMAKYVQGWRGTVGPYRGQDRRCDPPGIETSPTRSWLDSQRTWVSSGIRHQRIREPSRDLRG